VSASNPPNPEPSVIADRYLIVQKLGAGAFGTVYKAKDKVLGRMLAIKTIRLEGLAASQAGLKEMLDRFNREAQVAAQLRHPNIVTIYDFGESQGLTYLAMEYIEGKGLDSIIAANGRLPVPRAAALAAQVADALDYANQHHVVHRDIKPPNIMVESDDRVKVTDFGIAKPGDSAEHLTMTGSLLGTPAYMSPEQARGEKLDGKSDLFSLGCVLYEMVAGHKAFRGDSITALLFKILTEEPKPLQEVDPELPEEIVRIVNKAIAKRPENRYQSGREMAQDLLTLARPGNVPTLRAVDSPTLQPAATEIRTIHSSPTVMADVPGNVTARAGGATSAIRQAASPPPLPTVVAPAPGAAVPAVPAVPAVRAEATLRPDATGRVAATRREPPARVAAAPPPPTRRGPGVGLLLGLAAVVFVVFAGLLVGAWTLYRHRQAALEAAQPTPAPTAVAEMATPTPAPSPVAEATPGPTPTSAAPPPATSIETPGPTPQPEVARGRTTAGDARAGVAHRPPAAIDQTPASPRGAETAPAGDYGFLNEIPAESTSDGRAAGEALAQKYRSGGSTGITNHRFATRSKIPRDVIPVERPAVATLLHLMFVEQQYQRQNGRYGTLHDLRSAGLLRLDVPFQNGVFERRGYRFEVRGGAGEFKARAVPLVQGGRPFVADDSGYVLVDE